jgi:hypothetical protein
MKRPLLFLLLASTLCAQESKPHIGRIAALPSELPLVTATCTASRSGYLEKDGRTKITEAEMAMFIAASLRDGYILTIYPESKSGVFVDMECAASNKLTAPSHP